MPLAEVEPIAEAGVRRKLPIFGFSTAEELDESVTYFKWVPGPFPHGGGFAGHDNPPNSRLEEGQPVLPLLAPGRQGRH